MMMETIFFCQIAGTAFFARFYLARFLDTSSSLELRTLPVRHAL